MRGRNETLFNVDVTRELKGGKVKVTDQIDGVFKLVDDQEGVSSTSPSPLIEHLELVSWRRHKLTRQVVVVSPVSEAVETSQPTPTNELASSPMVMKHSLVLRGIEANRSLRDKP
uniref:Uncharacterized protein n=1 Tax=Timema poppense TaxID=170557 RepID=A0A7R9HD81_TIMPO|nr:unnamed protein product [Timema poppensis]